MLRCGARLQTGCVIWPYVETAISRILVLPTRRSGLYHQHPCGIPAPLEAGQFQIHASKRKATCWFSVPHSVNKHRLSSNRCGYFFFFFNWHAVKLLCILQHLSIIQNIVILGKENSVNVSTWLMICINRKWSQFLFNYILPDHELFLTKKVWCCMDNLRKVWYNASETNKIQVKTKGEEKEKKKMKVSCRTSGDKMFEPSVTKLSLQNVIFCWLIRSSIKSLKLLYQRT